MSILIYNPYNDSLRVRNNFRLADSDFYRPQTDIYETKDEIIVKMNLPGILKENISIDASFDELEVKTETPKISTDQEKSEESSEESSWISRHVERTQRNYYRKFNFNKPIDAEKAKVVLENGVLTISLPIRPEAIKTQLKIN